MNYLQRELVHVRGWRAGRIASVLTLGMLSCLPADNLSSYSNGTRPIESSEAVPGDALTEPPNAALATDQMAPNTAAAVADCGNECAAPALSIEPGQIGATAASEAEGSGDAGVPAPSADAGAAAADAGSLTCPQGAIVGPDQRCFELVTTLSSWANARTRCQSHGRGWDLATIRGATRNAWLTSMLGSITDAWVGASDLQTEGEWRWVGDSTAFWNGPGSTGSAVGTAYENWTDQTSPEPNGADASDCLRLRVGGGWADFQCATTYASLCEGPQL
jgi:hypothetical protein